MLLLQFVLNGFVSGCAIGVVAITFSYIYSTTGVFHVAHAGIYTLGAYIAYGLLGAGVPFVVALVVSAAICAAAGAAIQAGVYNTLARREASPLVMLIASLGMLAVLQNLMAMMFTPNNLQFQVPWRLNVFTIGGPFISYPQLAIVISSFIIFAGLMAFSRYSLMGQKIRAVASNAQLAQITRLQPERVFVIVLAIASALVAVPGILTGIDQSIQPYNSIMILLTAVIAVIAGGIGSIPGAFTLAIVISIALNVAILVAPGRWAIALTYALFIAFILVKPTGLFKTRVQRAS